MVNIDKKRAIAFDMFLQRIPGNYILSPMTPHLNLSIIIILLIVVVGGVLLFNNGSNSGGPLPGSTCVEDKCPTGMVCTGNGTCQPDPCIGVSCSLPKVCNYSTGGSCVDLCKMYGTTCSTPYICDTGTGRCVYGCSKCPTGQVCSTADNTMPTCITPCTPTSCPKGEVCDATTKKCIKPST